MQDFSRRAALLAALLSFGLGLGCDSASSTDDGAGANPGGVGGAETAAGSGGTTGLGGNPVANGGSDPAMAGAGVGNSGGAGTGGGAGASSSGGTAGGEGGEHAGGAPAGGMGGAAAGSGGVAGEPGSSAGTSAVAGGGSGSSSDGFTLAWQDDFDTLDTSRWALQTFSFDGNLAQFSTENASVEGGILTIALTPEPSDTVKPYRGVELRSVSTLTYGKVEARMRFAKGPGVVSGLVLIYTPWPADDWNEIDIEHLGKTSDASQLNCQVYTGPPTTPPVSTSVSPTQDAQVTPLGFDAESDFHLYTIEWTPEAVQFSADGTPLRTWTTEIARMKLPQNILFTIWASSATSWAGAISEATLPTTAQVDWIKVYSYAP